jgi:hypothetical protein
MLPYALSIPYYTLSVTCYTLSIPYYTLSVTYYTLSILHLKPLSFKKEKGVLAAELIMLPCLFQKNSPVIANPKGEAMTGGELSTLN